MAELTRDELLRPFQYHTVTLETIDRMTALRAEYYHLATVLVTMMPNSRERELALTHLQESQMRAIQALAMGEGTPIPIGISLDGSTATPPQ